MYIISGEIYVIPKYSWRATLFTTMALLIASFILVEETCWPTLNSRPTLTEKIAMEVSWSVIYRMHVEVLHWQPIHNHLLVRCSTLLLYFLCVIRNLQQRSWWKSKSFYYVWREKLSCAIARSMTWIRKERQVSFAFLRLNLIFLTRTVWWYFYPGELLKDVDELVMQYRLIMFSILHLILTKQAYYLL